MSNIVITGANQGIGYYFIEQALKNGHKVAVLDLETNNLEILAHTYPSYLLYYKVDVCNESQMVDAVKNVIKNFQKIDIAIHNACLCTFSKESNTDFDVYKQVFDVNYYGALRLVKTISPYMQAQKSGKFIFTSSGVGITGFIGVSPYASTKSALEALAKCLNLEYASNGITFHIVHPPLTRTKSAEPLPVPKEFMADPKKVGCQIALHISSRHFIICHSLLQKIQTMMCYLFPIKMGRLMTKMTLQYIKVEDK